MKKCVLIFVTECQKCYFHFYIYIFWLLVFGGASKIYTKCKLVWTQCTKFVFVKNIVLIYLFVY